MGTIRYALFICRFGLSLYIERDIAGRFTTKMLFGVKARVAIEFGLIFVSVTVLAVGAGWEKERAAGLARNRHNAA